MAARNRLSSCNLSAGKADFLLLARTMRDRVSGMCWFSSKFCSFAKSSICNIIGTSIGMVTISVGRIYTRSSAEWHMPVLDRHCHALNDVHILTGLLIVFHCLKISQSVS
ncbi:hypothetical protein M758_2G139700 [Ceratodon purpureus]|nr:hypothetical protein M758_2G139700 [Ceratodon purpureus]